MPNSADAEGHHSAKPDPSAFDQGVYLNLVAMQAEILWKYHRGKHADRSTEELADRVANRAIEVVNSRFAMVDESGPWSKPNIVRLVRQMLLDAIADPRS